MSIGDARDLLPAEIAQDIPALNATDLAGIMDPTAHVKWFTPDSGWTWYVAEYDPATRTAFGVAVGFERELGYFSVTEIEQVRGALGLPVERDLYFQKKPLSQCR
jgi:hypothetical protein